MIDTDVLAAGQRMTMTIAMVDPTSGRRGEPREDIKRCEVTTLDYDKMHEMIEDQCIGFGYIPFKIEYEGFDFKAVIEGRAHRTYEREGDGFRTPYMILDEFTIPDIWKAEFFNLTGDTIESDFDADYI